MKTYSGSRARETLEEHGIYMLTGEADGLGLRILYDLSEEGAKLVEGFIGTEIKRGNNWNRGGYNNEAQHVASIMLAYETRENLLTYIAGTENDVVVILHGRKTGAQSWGGYDILDTSSRCIIGMSTAEFEALRDDENSWIGRDVSSWLCYRCRGTAAGGLHNRHEFSGRVT